MVPENTSYVGDSIHVTTNPMGRGIEGVLVEILAGDNAGRTAATDTRSPSE